MADRLRVLKKTYALAGAILLTAFATSSLSAQDCLGALIAPARHAIGARLEPHFTFHGDVVLIGGEYLNVGPHLAWGVHAGGIVDEFPPQDPALAIGGALAYVGGPSWICPTVSVTRWGRESESDGSILIFRFGAGLAKVSGDSVRLAVWFHPHVTAARTHLTFGDSEATDWEREFFTDLGVAISGGRFWGSGALRLQFADDPGEDIPWGSGLMVRAGVRF